MKSKKLRVVSLGLMIVLGTSLVLGCAQPAPAPKPAPASTPAQAPKPAAPSPVAAPKPKPTATSPVAAPKPAAFKWPEPLVVGTKDTGSQAYLVTAAAADVLRRVKGVTMRVVPSGTDVARATLLVTGRAHFVTWDGSGAHLAQEGVYEWADIALGPQPVRTLSAGLTSIPMYAATAADANIKTWADAKGKRVVQVPGSPNTNLGIQYLLAFGGLTLKDVQVVNATSFGAGGRMVVEGKLDMNTGNPATPWVQELAASPRGLFWPQTYHSDEKGWERMRAVVPVVYKVIATQGAGVRGPLEMSTYPNSMWNLFDTANAELAYQFTKVMAEQREALLQTRVLGVDTYDVKKFLFDFPVPYHDGAIRYFKEAGLWTAEAQKNNDGLIKRQQILKQAWDKALAEVADKKVPSKDSSKVWERIRIEALQAAGLPVYYRS